MTPFLDLLSDSLKQWSFQEVTDSIPGGLKAQRSIGAQGFPNATPFKAIRNITI